MDDTVQREMAELRHSLEEAKQQFVVVESLYSDLLRHRENQTKLSSMVMTMLRLRGCKTGLLQNCNDAEMAEILDQVSKCLNSGFDYDEMLSTISGNPVLEREWSRFNAVLKLSRENYDG